MAARTANLCRVHTSSIPRKTPPQPDDKVATTAHQKKKKKKTKQKQKKRKNAEKKKRKSQVNAKETLRENLSCKTKAIKKLS